LRARAELFWSAGEIREIGLGRSEATYGRRKADPTTDPDAKERRQPSEPLCIASETDVTL